MKTEPGAEDLTVSRVQAGDEDDDDHDDHDDSDKINDTEGVDPERLKAFNVRMSAILLGHSHAGAMFKLCLILLCPCTTPPPQPSPLWADVCKALRG